MNPCEQSSRLGAFHDGEMPAEDRSAFERHLTACPQCVQELARLKKLSRLLDGLPRPAIAPSALRKVHAAVDKAAANSLVRTGEALAAVAASILLACLAAIASRPADQSSRAALPLWEAKAVSPQSADRSAAAPEDLLASWMVQDLSTKDRP